MLSSNRELSSMVESRCIRSQFHKFRNDDVPTTTDGDIAQFFDTSTTPSFEAKTSVCFLRDIVVSSSLLLAWLCS